MPRTQRQRRQKQRQLIIQQQNIFHLKTGLKCLFGIKMEQPLINMLKSLTGKLIFRRPSSAPHQGCSVEVQTLIYSPIISLKRPFFVYTLEHLPDIGPKTNVDDEKKQKLLALAEPGFQKHFAL